MARELLFPDRFVWGTAASGHQTEGHNDASDWWDFEQKEGVIADGTRSGRAVDYWNRFDDDHALMARLGYRAFRLGVEWAKVEPEPGRYDEAAIARYRDMLTSLRDHGLRPCLTLYHWVLPRWVARRGGWENPEVLGRFLGYVARMIGALGDLPYQWVTLNEPMVPVLTGYVLGYFPPERRSWLGACRVFRALLRAHAGAYRLLHERVRAPDGGPPDVGIAQACPPSEAWGSPLLLGWIERGLASFLDRATFAAWDRSILSGRPSWPWRLLPEPELPGLRGSYDYCGVNYYFRQSIKLGAILPEEGTQRIGPVPDGLETTDMGWQVYPPGFHRVLMGTWRRFGLPITITENGIADHDDDLRPRYLLTHLAQVHRAIADGADVRGYYYWSFCDNFEWREGFAKRFGLVACDHRDPALERRPRRSAELYGAIVRANGITEEIVRTYAPGAEEEVFGDRWRE